MPRFSEAAQRFKKPRFSATLISKGMTVIYAIKACKVI